MTFGRISQIASVFMLAAALPAVALPRAHRGPTGHTLLTKRHTTRMAASKPASQRVIAPERATEIQNALIKSGYMTAGSGQWDVATQSAMEKFQSDNGWQTKLVPDSRAIIKLGLGPNNEGNSAELSEAIKELRGTTVVE